MAVGAELHDVVNVPARTELMRGRFGTYTEESMDSCQNAMVDEIADTVEEN